MKILFIAPPFSGHLNRLVPLARAAQGAGHECMFMTGPAKADALRAQGFAVLTTHSIPGDSMERIANWHRQAGRNVLELVAQLRANLGLLAPLSSEIRDILTAKRPDVVVADSVVAIVRQWCAELDIPWITTIATPFAIEARRGVPSYLGGLSPRPGWAGRLRDAAGRLMVRGFKKLVFVLFARQLRPLLPRLYRDDGSEAIYSPQKILGFGLHELEFDRDWPSAFEMIGPVYGALEEAPPLVLPPAEIQVLASLGTHLEWAKDRFVADIARLAVHFPQWNFVVSLGRAAHAAERPAQLADNVTISAFVPYHRDLSRFHLVIHHGGSGITYAAICAGLPSLVVPHDYDQFDYAARIACHGLGLRVASLSEPAVPAMLLQLADRSAWPALPRFVEAAQRYRPQERFLAALAEVTSGRAAATPPEDGWRRDQSSVRSGVV